MQRFFLIASLVSFVSFSVRADESLHKGRPITAWLAELVDDDKEKQIRAEAEVQKMGTSALPAMLKYVAAPENPFGGNTKSSIVYRSFQLLGIKAKPAIPQLITLLQASDSRSDAATALIFIGDDTTPLLITVLTNKNPDVRKTALMVFKFTLQQPPKVQGVSTLSSNVEIALPAIKKCVKDADSDVSISAMGTLSAICTNTDLVVKEIIPNLESENARVRSFVTGILRFCGVHGKPAIPALKKALLDKDNDVRMNAALALHAIDPEEAKKAGAKVPLYE
jgi:HEAT repeat protein